MKPSSRRGFLRLMGAAPVAAVVEAEQGALAAVEAALSSSGGAPIQGGGYGGIPQTVWEQAYERLGDMWSDGRVPEWERPTLELEARRAARLLDPDLVAMRSLSAGAKLRLQERRCFDRIVAARVIQTRSHRGFTGYAKSLIGRVFS